MNNDHVQSGIASPYSPDADIRLCGMASPEVASVPPESSVKDAVGVMLACGIPSVVVVDPAVRPVGIVTERVILDAMHDAVSLADPVSGIMSILSAQPKGNPAEDLDEKKRVQEASLGEFVDSLPDPVWLVDKKGKFLACNARFCEHVGAPLGEILGKRLETIFGAKQARQARKQDRLVMETGGKVTSEESFGSAGLIFETVRVPVGRENAKPDSVLCISRDISRRKQAEQELRDREEVFSAIVNRAADSIMLIDAQSLRFVEFNRVAHQSLGYTREEFEKLTLVDIQAELVREQIRERIRSSFESGSTILFDTLHRKKDGTFRETRVSSSPVLLHGKSYLSAIWSDIGEQKRAQENLRITASVFDNSQEGIFITDSGNRIIEVNPAFSRITGYSREEVLGRDPRLMRSGRHSVDFYRGMWQSILEEGGWRGEIWNRRKSGEIFAELLSISAILDGKGKASRHVAIFSDISHFKAHEEELSRIAHYDALTGIPNRVLLEDRMRQGIAQTMRERNMMAVCYLDLDGFKSVNDTLGHEAGDAVLVEVARRISGGIRGGDTVARLGGDEFVVLLLGLSRGEECAETLDRLHRLISAPIDIRGTSAALGASIGVSIYPIDNQDADTLLRHADQAMYVAKESGKNRYHIYDSSLDRRARDRSEFSKSVKDALQAGQFELHYQPKIDLRTGRFVGAEALLRWHHPERGLLYPGEFLALAKNSELEIELGEWVIETALDQSRKWRKAGLDIDISINVSIRHLESPGFVERLKNRLGGASGFQVEMMETVDTAKMGGIIDSCRELGVRFALDDFGTGKSSFSSLGSLPFEEFKIDRSFVLNMMQDRNHMAIVRGIISLARAFERHIVAEGIETGEQISALVEMGCEMGQGYGIARPMTAGELEKWIQH
ncbi:MAG: EAL domain-containing protein [Burkholderiales bacterium]|nr:EAL domain-containing protein [Burkholderiales bacterium]